MEKVRTKLEQNGAVLIKGLIPKEFCYMYTHTMMMSASRGEGKKSDDQIENPVIIMDHEIVFETLLERIWPTVEHLISEQVYPTYAYSRLYQNGNILEPHTDRDACEISLTVQLGRSHNYSWPIFVEGNKFELEEGDAVLYLGRHVSHWREECKGPEGYYSGQVFLHYVIANGECAKEAYDGRALKFDKLRTAQMESK